MGSPDGTKIALGLFASTSAVILSYILLKKYGFRASGGKLVDRGQDESEYSTKEKESFSGELEPPKPGQDKPSAAEPDTKRLASTKEPPSNEGGDDGHNQTSFIVLGGGAGAPLDGDNGVKKSDRSSDESSYDVIEDDRLADAMEDEEEENKVASGGGGAGAESALETSMVLVDPDQAGEGKSEPSFYTSADENFGMGLGLEAEEEEDSGVNKSKAKGEGERAILEEGEVTVMHRPPAAGAGNVEDESGGSLERTKTAEDDSAGSLPPLQIDESCKETEERAHAISDAVQEANLEAVAPLDSDNELDPSEVAEMLSKCQNAPMSVTNKDIHMLVQLLRKNTGGDLHVTVLNSIIRIAAFNQNTTNLRESGCPEEIVRQLKQLCGAMTVGEAGLDVTLTPLTQVLTNLSLDPKAHPKLEASIPTLINLIVVEEAAPSDSLSLTILRPLVNLSGEAPYHHYYTRAVPTLLGMLDTGSHMVKVQALKVLVNLSLDADMVPHLLAAEAPKSLENLLSPPTQNDVILRTVTMLANVTSVMKDTPSDSLTTLPGFAQPANLYSALTEEEKLNNLRSRVFRLTRDGDEDVRVQAARLYKCIPEEVS